MSPGYGQAELEKGSQVVLTTRPVEGDASLVPVTIPHLPQDVHVDGIILLDDGAIQLKVLSVQYSSRCYPKWGLR